LSYPTINDYLEAIQVTGALLDPVLRGGKVAKNSLGLPNVLGGGFALTFMVTAAGKHFAVRCFQRNSPDIETRYRAIGNTLSRLKDDHFVEFEFQTAGIRVNGKHYPIVKMAWAKGSTLGEYIEDNYENRSAMHRLLASFRQLEKSLRSKSLAHGDIQNGNVIVQDGVQIVNYKVSSDKELTLIDYDGVFVPGMRIGNGTEVGQRHFQHPKRKMSDFGPSMDRFSFILVDLSLRALMERPRLFETYSNGENILFSAGDFVDPAQSPIFAEVKAIQALSKDTQNFANVCSASPSAVPTLEDFLLGKNIPAQPIIIAPKPPAGIGAPVQSPSPYIGAYDVLDAADFTAVMRKLGDRIELVGCIKQVQTGNTRYGRPYAFLMFGSKDNDIVRVTIWSEGLAKLTSHRMTPDSSWRDQWVSVTGLVDSKYKYPKKGNTHVGITIRDTTQIRKISEVEARRRLQGGTETPEMGVSKGASRNTAVLKSIGRAIEPSLPTQSPPTHAPAQTIGNPVSRNSEILRKLNAPGPGEAAQPRTTPLATPHSTIPSTPSRVQRSSASKQPSFKIPIWVWYLVVVFVFYLLSHLK
jgi:hypothetical protein